MTVYVRDAQALVGQFTVPLKAGRTDFRLPSTLPPGTYYLKTRLDGQAQSFTLQVD